MTKFGGTTTVRVDRLDDDDDDDDDDGYGDGDGNGDVVDADDAATAQATRAVALAQARVASCRRMSCAFILMPLSSGVMEQPETETELDLDWESDFAV